MVSSVYPGRAYAVIVTPVVRVSTTSADSAMTCDVNPETRDQRSPLNRREPRRAGSRTAPRKVATGLPAGGSAQVTAAVAESRHLCVLIDIWGATR